MSEATLAEPRETCPHCGAAMQMFSADEDWCPKCKHRKPGASGNTAAGELAALRNQLATATAEARRYITADDAIGEVCLQSGFDCESTLEAVQAMAARLVEVASERDELLRRLAEAPVGFILQHSTGRFGTELHYSGNAASAEAKKHSRSVVRVRLVRDEQPEETVK